MFDNAPSHLKRAADALSAREMPKGVFQLVHLHHVLNLPNAQVQRLVGHA
jgi:hypothetical protein